MNRTEPMKAPKYSTRWTTRPDRTASCCERHQRQRTADDRQRAIAENRTAKRNAWTIDD